MSTVLCPVMGPHSIDIRDQHNNGLATHFYRTCDGGRPTCYVSGTCVIVNYPDGCRVIIEFDENGRWLGEHCYN